MVLKKLLEEKRSSIVKNWVQMTLDSYAPDAAMFFSNQMNDFLNPVGGTIRSSLESLYDTILFKKDVESIKSILEPEAVDGKLLMSMVTAIQQTATKLGLDTQGFYIRTNAGTDGVTPHMHWHIYGPGIP